MKLSGIDGVQARRRQIYGAGSLMCEIYFQEVWMRSHNGPFEVFSGEYWGEMWAGWDAGGCG